MLGRDEIGDDVLQHVVISEEASEAYSEATRLLAIAAVQAGFRGPLEEIPLETATVDGGGSLWIAIRIGSLSAKFKIPPKHWKWGNQ